MKKSKTLIIISIIFIILGIAMITTSIVLSSNIDKKPKNNNNKEMVVEEKSKQIIDTNYLSQDTDKKTIEELTGQTLSYHDIYVGKDSFVSYKPSSDFIKQNHLEDYEKLQAKYAPIVEKRFIDGTSYTIKKDNNTLIYTFKPWYYGAYSSDLKYMINYLLKESNEVSQEDMENATDKYKIYEYKARAKSLYILNKYLSNYDNQDEEFEFVLELQDGKISQEDQYSIYMNLQGNRSEKVPGSNNTEAVAQRTNTYINEAKNSGIIDSKDVLSIKGLS